MLEKLKETIIISLGGSVVAHGEIDVEFLKNFKKTLQKYLKTKRFFIFTGGGKIARLYQKALSELGANDKERDEIGVNVTRLNGEIVKHLFSEFSYPEVIINPTKKIKTEKKIIVGAGWRSGWSTDYVSVLAAKTNNIKTIVNLTNIDYVYDKNPKEFPGAKAIKEINWPDFRKIVGDKWSPG
ncbi:MAG: UMP kinase, partial [Candidatus Staskawiczbacteria bacterium]|nr:UMP kinase [Candidatus Staskawiczbacteria bacterium]